MSRNKSSNSRSWAQADVSPFSMLRQSVYEKENNEERIGQKRKIMTIEVCPPLPKITDGWIVTKKKRSGGGKMRSANGNQKHCIGGAHMLTPSTYEDSKTVQDATGTGIPNQVGMDVSTNFKQRTNLLPTEHIDKFLTGNSSPMTRNMKSAPFQGRVLHNTSFSGSIEERTNGFLSARRSQDNGGPLFKRLLSALIDENQDLDTLRKEKNNALRLREWETDFLGSVPDESLLLKELHLVGIFPEILPALVEREDDTDHDNENPQDAISPKLASKQPLESASNIRRSSRLKSVNHAMSGASSNISSDAFAQHKRPRNSITEENIKKSTKSRRCGRRNDMSSDSTQNDNTIELYSSTVTNTCHETESKKVTNSASNANFKEIKPASPNRITDQLIIGDNSMEGQDVIGFPNTIEDLSFLLDLDVDDLPQDGDDNFNLKGLDTPMDDLSTLNFDFIP